MHAPLSQASQLPHFDLLGLELIVPTLCVGMPPWTLRVPMCASISSPVQGDAERHRMYSHAERGNDHL
ncbi:hypothetical protein FEM54_13260 [Pseudomonas edaphica]|uniref:Uncharacterized protein n=1 Tax=Pseudomonas edaphica TaxID=2006980 RepID=A0ABY2UAC3_9PSED|nr:hypothetical protein FEM54_13260 [Pseudomonas edaphica]